jgi:hypothetical protein
MSRGCVRRCGRGGGERARAQPSGRYGPNVPASGRRAGRRPVHGVVLRGGRDGPAGGGDRGSAPRPGVAADDAARARRPRASARPRGERRQAERLRDGAHGGGGFWALPGRLRLGRRPLRQGGAGQAVHRQRVGRRALERGAHHQRGDRRQRRDGDTRVLPRARVRAYGPRRRELAERGHGDVGGAALPRHGYWPRRLLPGVPGQPRLSAVREGWDSRVRGLRVARLARPE